LDVARQLQNRSAMQETKAGAAESLSLVAEVHLGLSHGKAHFALISRVFFAGLATLLCAQVLLLLIALMPMMLHWVAWPEAVLGPGMAAVLTLMLLAMTKRELRKLKAT
jgi:hypothetical protein